ncbi:hypothetical protein SmJEL517_g04298 [Synchytrium microbalum]|uniref:P-loop containing nucleoside triphosphate hydrolase protein n=1 Tax=Synchytrium microbalum TaxID=1806994 RepID=A0A507BYW5_9FUNG|nr:uncharacterized protein SmJEL517_g04298 [Synchytrium microbalum]TPX32622.1 hypothetical protein SmJEL517_g04298 [Synchytrium microbalum]
MATPPSTIGNTGRRMSIVGEILNPATISEDLTQQLETPIMSSRGSTSSYKSQGPSFLGNDGKDGVQHQGATDGPEVKANIFAKMFFTWMTPLMFKGYRNPLQQSDLYSLLPKFDAKYISDIFHERIGMKRKAMGNIESEEIERGFRGEILKSFFMIMWKDFLMSAVFEISQSWSTLLTPLILSQILRFLSTKDTPDAAPLYTGYCWALLLFFAQVNVSISNSAKELKVRSLGVRMKTIMVSAIFRKSLRLSARSRHEYPSGRVMNLLAQDTNTLEWFSQWIHDMWSVPVQIIFLSLLLVYYLGRAGAFGVLCVLLGLTIQFVLMRVAERIESKALNFSDSRVKLTSEALQGMKIIKFFSWETFFINRLTNLREEDLKRQRWLAFINSTFNGIVQLIPVVISITVFSLYWYQNGRLDPVVIFPALSAINILRGPMIMMPLNLQLLWQAIVAVRRLAKYLSADELDSPPTVHDASDDKKNSIVIKESDFFWQEWETWDPSVTQEANTKSKQSWSSSIKTRISSIKNALFKNKSNSNEKLVKEDSPAKPTIAEKPPSVMHLQGIDFTIPKGSLTAIVGSVGCGKSSLLGALTGEMSRAKGSVDIYGTTALANQQGWITNDSIKNNVLFGTEYDAGRYREVVRVTALERDLREFADGDLTEVGTQGLTLSGGQIARVSLARAIYRNADIIYMDDVLAAVDSHVGAHIFEKCIRDYCSDKTRLLVTHQIHFLPQVDYILYMEKGQITERGTYHELLSANGSFAKLVEQYGVPEEEESKEARVEAVGSEKLEIPNGDLSRGISSMKRKNSVATTSSFENKDKPRALMSQEEREEGSIKFTHYLMFMNAFGGIWVAVLMLVGLVVYIAFRLASDLMLLFWTTDRLGKSFEFYIILYAVFGALFVLGSYLHGLFVFLLCLKASKNLHNAALARVFKSPMSFFETQPLGRILSRFSRDVSEIDRFMAQMLRATLNLLGSMLGTIGLIAFAVPYMLILFAIIVPSYIVMQNFYSASNRELKRLESLARSPLFAQVSESLTGLPTIRAYREQTRFTTVNNNLLNEANKPTYLRTAAGCWVSIRAQCMVAVMVWLVPTLGIALNVPTAILGLALSYGITILGLLNWSLRNIAEIESRMNSIERLGYYGTQLPQERTTGNPKPDGWPFAGEITLKHVELKYREELDPVLKDVSLNIHGAEKIGVVGRTGAGKSSIIAALFSLVELSKGSIEIDGVDTSTLTLKDLRNGLSIIPQTPTLFDGSVRSNLDMSGIHTDDAIWTALRRCGLYEVISSLDGKLESQVSEGGENFSVGQRQLMCLGRAMLSKARIILIDEATASVDVETDAKIQELLRQDFAHYTIITIAHRQVFAKAVQ